MKTKSPITYVRYEPHHMLARCLGLSPLAELAHRRLCDHYWLTGHWPPANAAAIAEITRCAPDQATALINELKSGQWRDKRGAFVSHYAVNIRSEARSFQANATAKGRRGAQARWHETPDSKGPNEPPPPEVPTLPDSHAQALPEAMPKPGHSSTVHKRTLNALNAERLTLSALPREGNAPEESAFFEQLETVLQPIGARKAALEMSNWGGWWRNRFRESPDKTRRVIADVSNMLKEGTVIKSFGAAAFDLWKRLPA